ncbi:MAG: S9 family peptidase [Candidatus Kapabacteria bacterium]|nr:S9 family peptidase [Candidatus Kapabacteria bacterium]
MRYIITMIGLMTNSLISAQSIDYPLTRLEAVVDTIHGRAIADPYRWLENDHDPEVEAWVGAQADASDAYLQRISFRTSLLSRLDTVTNFTRYSAPWHRAGRTFYYRNDGRQNHNVLYMLRDGESIPTVVLDPNTWSTDGTVALAFAEESPDGRYLAFGKTQGGSDWRDIYVLDLATMQLLPDVITRVKNSSVSWYNDGFYYTRYDAAAADAKSLVEKNTQQIISYHKLGTAQSADATVFTDPDNPEQFVSCYVLERSSYLIRTVRRGNVDGNDIYVRPAGSANAPWIKIFGSDVASFYPQYDHEGVLYGTTTLDAPNGRVVRITNPLTNPTMETVVAERDYLLDNVAFGAGKMFLTWMKDVQHTVEIASLSGTITGTVTLPGVGSVGGFGGQPEDTTLYYTFTSYTFPTTIYRYDVATGTSSVWQRVEAPFDPETFQARQVFVTSKDGTRIPMVILSRRDAPPTPAPTMLYGYGGFNISLNPGFNAAYIPWLEQGSVIAIANLRGGGEYGEAWHRAGMRRNKQNVFDDAIACAEWLIREKITTRDLLAMNGRSNGGLLVGAVVNQRPDLFRVAIPEVGVMDMLRFHRFTIGWNWQADYGEIDKPDEFAALAAYSPYHNLREGVDYPSTMTMTADHDDRVVPAHSFKYAAQLQHVYRGPRPMLLRVKRKSGHGDVNRTKNLEGTADKYAFMWYEMGVQPTYPVR